MRAAILSCLIYLCLLTTVQTLFFWSLSKKTDMIRQNIEQQVFEAQQQLSNQIACQLGDKEFCE